MNIPKAMEINELNLKLSGKHMPTDVRDALKLSNEALKREKSNRENPDFVMVGKLPGETD